MRAALTVMIALVAATSCGGVVANGAPEGGPLLDATAARDGNAILPILDAGLKAVIDGGRPIVDAMPVDQGVDAACEPEWIDAGLIPPGGQCCITNVDCEPHMCCEPAPERRGNGWGHCFVCPISQ